MALELGILVGLTMGLTEIVKRIGIEGKYLPVFALLFGVGLSYLGGIFELNAKTGVLEGIVVGLSAMGLFSGGKSVLGK